MRRTLPLSGKSWEEIDRHLQDMKALDDIRWKQGFSTKSAYYVDEDLLEGAERAYCTYLSENRLFGSSFKGLQLLESEVIDMAIGLLRGDEQCCGTFTSGGSESNFLAVAAARERARSLGRLRSGANIVMPATAHVTIDKAAHYLGLKVVRTPLGPDLRGSAAEMLRAIDDETVMLIGSAPCWPYGLIDPIPALGQIAREKGLWMHVDACVGGFCAPFVSKLGFPVPPFDLSISTVDSVSADIHKYGFAPKGASLILYRSQAHKDFSRFEYSGWPSGFYQTYTVQGSRGGGAIAAAWATLSRLGEGGYLEAARRIMQTKHRVEQLAREIDPLEVLVKSDLYFTAYRSTSREIDIHAVADGLEDRGWSVSRLKTPPAVHLPLTPVHHKSLELYAKDLRAAVAEVRSGSRVSRGLTEGYL